MHRGVTLTVYQSPLPAGLAEKYRFKRGRWCRAPLVIETDASLSVLERARIKATLEERLELAVDIVAVERQRLLTPFQRIAKSGAVRLESDP
jgi:hypothetical protein